VVGLRRFAGLGAGYWKLLTASGLSGLGDGVSLVAYPWLAATLTRNPVVIAIFPFAVQLPWLLASLPAGAIVDRLDRRAVMVTMDSARMVVTAVVGVTVLTGTASVPLLLALALLTGTANVLFENASQTILPSIVAREHLQRANGTFWTVQWLVNQFLGPALGGVLIAASLAVPFLFDAGSFAASAALVLLITGVFRPGRRGVGTDAPAASGSARRSSLHGEIGQGLRWLWRHRLLRTLTLMAAGSNGAFSMIIAIQVFFAQEVLHLDARRFGLLLSGIAVGGLLGSHFAPDIAGRVGSGTVLRMAMAVGAGCMAVSGLTSNPVLFGVMGALDAFVMMHWNVVAVSLRQAVIPDRLLGRVNGAYRFFSWGANVVGLPLGGLLVLAASHVVGRHTALRLPYLATAAAYLVMLALAWSAISTREVELAERAAEPDDSAVPA
jgi:MFS family permease